MPIPTRDEKEQNLFNAMETLGQFYEEIESFYDILHSRMAGAGFSIKGERLRSGTFTVRHLSRRLLATATVIYVRAAADDEDVGDEDDLDGDSDDDEGIEPAKLAKAELPITPSLRVPFARVALFEPRTIPTARTLGSPILCVGAFGDLSVVEKKSGEPASPENPVAALSSLSNIRLRSKHKVGEPVRLNVGRPARMKKFRLEGRILGFETMPLLEIDSQDKIRGLADKLTSFVGD